MSKVMVNSDVLLKGVKIYVEGGALYVELVGEAMSDIGPVNFNFKNIQLDFNTPEQTGAGIFCFRDGRGRVGYDFNFGDVLYKNEEDEPANAETTSEDSTVEQNVDTEDVENNEH